MPYGARSVAVPAPWRTSATPAGRETGCGSCHDFLACALRYTLPPDMHGDACFGVMEPSVSPAFAGVAHAYEGETP